MLNLSTYTTLLLDMDGVLYRGDNPLPGVNDLLALCARRGVGYACVTNNSTLTPQQYDVLVMGADKWHQVIDPRYYGHDPAARDAAVAALPELAIARRAPFAVPVEHELDVDAAHEPVSSSAVRDGVREWMCAAAADFDARTGAWSDPARYVAGGRDLSG